MKYREGRSSLIGSWLSDSADRSLRFRLADGLRVSWPDWINNPTLVVCASEL